MNLRIALSEKKGRKGKLLCKNLESTSTFYGAKAVAVMRQSRGLWCTEDYENGIGKQTRTEDSILFSKRWSFKNCGMFKSWNGLYCDDDINVAS